MKWGSGCEVWSILYAVYFVLRIQNISSTCCFCIAICWIVFAVFHIQFRFVKCVGKVCWWMDPSFVMNFNVWSCRPVVPRCMKRLQRRRRQLKRPILKHMMTSGMKAMKSPMVTKIWLNGFKSRTRYAWDASDISILAKKAPTFKSWSF